ncbi:MAG: DNA repair protein RecN [Polyangiaceae bacterium]|nr:DNA repair protein RecN [Polyangiaceae bacterium]
MLSVLRLKNFVLMEELELTLEPGLNVLTGETGAGKSIVVGALGVVLGGRASADHVRPGAEEAEVEALFDLGDLDAERAPAIGRLTAAGIVTGSELAVRRVISSTGRSRAYLNGRLCTTSELASLAPELADIASQHESVQLTDPATHLEHLDRFAKLEDARSELGRLVAELEAILSSIEELRSLERSRGEREAFLRFQLQSIQDVSPRAGEVDELQAERKKLRHIERLLELVRRATARLDAEGGLCDELARVASDLRAASELDDSLEPLARSVDACWTELRDTASQCARYAESSEVDPSRLPQVEERLYKLEGLLRQHGPTLEELLAAQARLERDLADITGAESRLAAEEASLEKRIPATRERALALSAQRKKAAERLGLAISAELHELGMGGARVAVEVEPIPTREAASTLSIEGARLGRSGIDRVEFLIAPNKGAPPKPLRKIASGGELSRALLALKRVLADRGSVGLYVFDEVDTGVGGAVAERIGAAIADVAKHHQVLCITHLAPIAAFGDAHFVVTKSSDKGTTTSSVERVDGDGRIHEVARMMAGAKVTGSVVAAAKEMIEGARGRWKVAKKKKG